MKTIRTVLLVAVMTLGSAGALAASTPQASIPFLSLQDSIYGWQTDGAQGLWIQDIRKQWFYAKLMAPCDGLEFTPVLGFEAKHLNTLDRFGAVLVPGSKARCQIDSLTKSEAPPKEERFHKTSAAKPAKAR